MGDLTSVAQHLMHYFDTRGGTTPQSREELSFISVDNPHHNITSRSHRQEAIQFRAAENVIDQDSGLGSNHRISDSQADTLAVELSRSLQSLKETYNAK